MIGKSLEIHDQLGSNAKYFNPFGPPMLHFTLNDTILNLITACVNDFKDHHDDLKTGRIVQGTNADENQNNSIVNGEIYGIPPEWQDDNHGNILGNTVREVTMLCAHACARAGNDDIALREYSNMAEKIENDIKSFIPEIESIWYVVLKSGDFHILHDHAQSNNTYSGAIYLKTPDVPYPQGKMNWIVSGNSGHMFNNIWGVQPRVGDVFMWPSWVFHTVYPFNGEGERIMISFNSSVKIKKTNDK